MHSAREASPVDRLLVDHVLDAYVCWRERGARVWEAYERWCAACVADAAEEFATYRDALDREELAARRYADLMTRLADSLATDA